MTNKRIKIAVKGKLKLKSWATIEIPLQEVKILLLKGENDNDSSDVQSIYGIST